MNKIFYTCVLSALVLLSAQCNPKPQESDEQIGNDSIIEYAGCCTDIYSFPRHKTFHRIYRKEPS